MSPIETLLARVRKEHGWLATYCQFGPAMECTCGHLVDDHNAHQNQMIADALRGEGLVETIEQAILNAAVDHPMWIDNTGAPLDYHPEREARIGDYTTTAARAVIDSLCGTKETT